MFGRNFFGGSLFERSGLTPTVQLAGKRRHVAGLGQQLHWNVPPSCCTSSAGGVSCSFPDGGVAGVSAESLTPEMLASFEARCSASPTGGGGVPGEPIPTEPDGGFPVGDGGVPEGGSIPTQPASGLPAGGGGLPAGGPIPTQSTGGLPTGGGGLPGGGPIQTQPYGGTSSGGRTPSSRPLSTKPSKSGYTPSSYPAGGGGAQETPFPGGFQSQFFTSCKSPRYKVRNLRATTLPSRPDAFSDNWKTV